MKNYVTLRQHFLKLVAQNQNVIVLDNACYHSYWTVLKVHPGSRLPTGYYQLDHLLAYTSSLCSWNCKDLFIYTSRFLVIKTQLVYQTSVFAAPPPIPILGHNFANFSNCTITMITVSHIKLYCRIFSSFVKKTPPKN